MAKKDVLAIMLGGKPGEEPIANRPLTEDDAEMPEEGDDAELEAAFQDAAVSASSAAREGNDAAFSEHLRDAIAIYMEKNSPEMMMEPPEVI